MKTALVVTALVALAAGCSAPADSGGPASQTSDLGSAPPFGPEPAGSPVRYPIVLAHGFNASPTNEWGFNGVQQALLADGHLVVHVAWVPPYNAADVRAQTLASHVDQAIAECQAIDGCDASHVNIIAHSMGGLDSRSLIVDLGYGDRVASLTTISTPHRGSAIADVGLGFLPGSLSDVINSLAAIWAETYTTDDLANQTDVRAALSSLAEANAQAFNDAHPDDSRVYYQSYAGVSNVLGIANPQDESACEGTLKVYENRRDVMNAQLVGGAAFVAHGLDMKPNDGMSTVESAKWGTFRGCIPADHLDEVGQPNHSGPDAHTGFDAVRFYRNVAFDLARQGF